jgi:hypothetical protein
MNNQEGTQKAGTNDRTEDVANNEVGPTEKLREGVKGDDELSAPGSQNPASKEIKDEQSPNSE